MEQPLKRITNQLLYINQKELPLFRRWDCPHQFSKKLISGQTGLPRSSSTFCRVRLRDAFFSLISDHKGPHLSSSNSSGTTCSMRQTKTNQTLQNIFIIFQRYWQKSQWDPIELEDAWGTYQNCGIHANSSDSKIHVQAITFHYLFTIWQRLRCSLERLYIFAPFSQLKLSDKKWIPWNGTKQKSSQVC